MALVDRYTSALQSLLPLGKLFNRVIGSNLTNLLSGFAIECQRVDDSVSNYIDEGIPNAPTLTGLLPEWERAVGIPDECVPLAATESERQAHLLLRLSDVGGSSIAYWENRASVGGFPGTIVTEPGGIPPFIIGFSVMGDPLGDGLPSGLFKWTVTFPIASVGTSSVECDFELNKPAHTEITFVNSG